jgi:PAS domain S-box-containing protein
MSEDPSASSQRRFLVALCAAAVACLVFAALLGSSLPAATRESISAGGLTLGGLAVLVSSALAARRSTGRRRSSWIILSAAAGTSLLTNAVTATFGIDPVKEPELVGAALAGSLVLSIIGLVRFPAARQRGAELGLMLLDGLVMGCAVLVIASITVFTPVMDAGAGDLGDRAAALLLPCLDVVLATFALLLLIRSEGDRGCYSLIGAGFLMCAVADMVFAVEAAHGTFQMGTLQDLGWIAGYLVFAAAAWHPQAAVPARASAGSSTSDVRGTILVFAILLTALVVQLVYPKEEVLTRTQTVLWVLLVLAAGLRQTLLAADNSALRHGLERRVREQTADLRRMSRHTETLLSSVGDGIYGLDLDGRITFLNPSAEQILGHPAGDLLGRIAHDAFHGPQVDGSPYPWTGCYVTEAIEHGLVSSAEEDTYLRADGTSFPVEITASPLLDEDRISGAVVVFRDVTQRHEVDRMKNEFLSVVSHELRTPLTSIRGSLGLISSGALVELTPQAERMVSIAVESSDRLTRLINDILDIERIQSGKLPMNLVPQESSELLRASAVEMGGLAASSGVGLEVVERSGRVLADRDRIVQTLTNLVGNAVKFSSPGSTVRLESFIEAKTVVFAVHDDGRGIPADKLEAVFDPFEQVDSSDARQKGGTGLGLAISRGIVERHGGRIWAESELGTGTTVRFTLPRVRDLERMDEDAPADAPVILVCDDDPSTVMGFSGILAKHGYRPEGVSTGAEAVERATRSRPAAVVLDMVMPGTSGAQVIAQLRADERTENIPVVVVSGTTAATDPSAAASVDNWLVKPVTEEHLVVAVGAALDDRRRAAGVLIVEDDQDLARVLIALLSRHGLNVVHVSTVAEAVRLGTELQPKVIVLDLDLPDGLGTEAIEQLRRREELRHAAVVIYTATDLVADTGTGSDPVAQLSQNGPGSTVFLTKARVAPWELEKHVLRLMDEDTGNSMGEHSEGATHVGA